MTSGKLWQVNLAVCRAYRSTARRRLDDRDVAVGSATIIRAQSPSRSSTIQCHGVRLLRVFLLLLCFRKSLGSDIRRKSSRKHSSRASDPIMCDRPSGITDRVIKRSLCISRKSLADCASFLRLLVVIDRSEHRDRS